MFKLLWKILYMFCSDAHIITDIMKKSSYLVMSRLPKFRMDEDICKFAIMSDYDYKSMQFIPKRLQTKSIIEIALKKDIRALQYVKPIMLNDDIIDMAVKINVNAYDYIPSAFDSHTLRVQLVSMEPSIVRKFDDPEYDVCLIAVRNKPELIKYIPTEYHNETLCSEVVTRDGMLLENIFCPSRNTMLEAVQENGLALQFIEEFAQDEEICDAAIAQNINALKFAFKASEGACAVAILAKPELIKLIKVECEEAYKIAVNINPMFLEYVPGHMQTYDMCLSAVKRNGLALKFVNDITLEICIAAIKQNFIAINYIDSVTAKIICDYIPDDILKIGGTKEDENKQQED